MKLLLFFAVFAFTTQAFSTGRPNIIIILADDLGFSDLGCYGGEIETPNIDRLSAGGVRFSAFYTSARCCPSRASLVTGLHPHQAGIGSFANAKPRKGWGPSYTGHLLPTCATIGEILGDSGYSTWMAGKWHMGIPGPIQRGFSNYFGYKNFLAHSENQWEPTDYVRLPESAEPELDHPADNFYVTDVFSDYALEFLKQSRKKPEQPFLLYLAHSSPHFPIQAPVASIDKYVPIYRQGWDKLRAARLDRMKKLGVVSEDLPLPPKSKVPVDRDDIANGFSGEPNPDWDSLPEERREDLARRMATFAAMVEHVDVGIGRILTDLERHDELENTLIFFLADNGACYEWGPFGFDGRSRTGTTILHKGDALAGMGQANTHSSYGSGWANLGNTPLSSYKHFCHEGGIASPLIAHWPEGIKAKGAWVRDPAHLMDIVPTILDATGAEYPKERAGHEITPVEGISLLPAIHGSPLPERTLAFEHQQARGLRKGDWKVVWGKRQREEITWELYNIANDRSEQNNLATDHPELTQTLAASWEAWAKKVGAEPFQHSGSQAETPPAPATDSPRIAGRPLTITAEVKSPTPHGVVLAQGGREQGFALHFVEGKPAFDVRVDGKVTRLLSDDAIGGKITLVAILTEHELSLSVNGAPPTSVRSPGLIPSQPKDDLSIGFDDLSAAGNYEAPNRFNGTIIGTRVTPKGNVDKPVPPPKTGSALDRPPILQGLKSHDRALFVETGWIRDPYIILGPDGFFYLTGTTPLPDDPRQRSDPYNTGLGKESIVGWKMQAWRSDNLADWESLGTPFTLEDGIWPEVQPDRFENVERGDWRLWAPELHWLGDRWALVHTSPAPVKGANLSLSSGTQVIGPWENPMGATIARRHDPSLFKDDGTWWMIWGATSIAPLKSDFSGFASDPVVIGPSGETAKMGHEGCLIQKILGKYVLFGTGWSTGLGRRGSYNLYYATADKITGPYSERKFAGRFLGHGTPFQDKESRWWCTAFYNANIPPLPTDGIRTRDLSETAQTINQQGVTLVPLDVQLLESGELHIRAKDPDYAAPGPDEAQKFE